MMKPDKSKSQARRLNAQATSSEATKVRIAVDVDLLVQELAMANGHTGYLQDANNLLKAEMERLQAKIKELEAGGVAIPMRQHYGAGGHYG